MIVRKIANKTYTDTVKINCSIIAIAAVVLLLSTTPAEAAAGHGQPKITDITWFAINFTLFCVIMYRLLRQPIGRLWVARADKIDQAVSRAERDLQKAKESYDLIKKDFDRLTPEYLQSISKQIEQEGQREASDLITQAQLKTEQLKSQADLTLLAEQNAAQTLIRRKLGESILTEVEKLVKNRYTTDHDQKRRRQALDEAKALLN